MFLSIIPFGLGAVIDNGDSAAQNRKAMLYIGKHAGDAFFCFANMCCVHQLFRSVATCLERLELVRPMYALTNVMKLASRQDQMRRQGCCGHCQQSA